MKPINMHDTARSHDERTVEIVEQARLICERLMDHNEIGERVSEAYTDGRICIRATRDCQPDIIRLLIGDSWHEVFHSHRDFLTRYRPGFWELYLTTLHQKALATPLPQGQPVWQMPADPHWDCIDDGEAFVPAGADDNALMTLASEIGKALRESSSPSPAAAGLSEIREVAA